MWVRHLVLVMTALSVAAGCSAPPDGPPSGEPQAATVGGVAAPGDALSAPVGGDDEPRRRFADCMREQGAELAAPGTQRREPPTTGPEAERLAAAMELCRVHLPGGGIPQMPSPDDIDKALAYAKCLRDNGVPYYPDPDPETGRPQLTTELGERLKRDPQRAVADERCRDLMPPMTLGGGANG